MKKYPFIFICLVLFSILYTYQAAAQFDNLDRDIEAITMTADQFPIFNGVPFDQLFLYAFDKSTNSWTQIPFQFDDVDDQEHYFAETDQILDDYDELTFMARDAGDSSTVAGWITDISSQGYNRYEIKITDSIDPSRSAWVYLYRSSTLTYVADDLLSYNNTTNQITSSYYQLGLNSDGTLNDLLITAAGGGNGIDIIDREKIRSSGQYNTYSYTFTEEDMTLNNVQIKDGTVRVLRQVDISFSLFDQAAEKDITEKYYDRFSITGGSYGHILADYGIHYLRQSLDLNSNAGAMTFYGTNNAVTGATIDGINDAVDTSLPAPGTSVWSMVTGTPGSIIQLVNLPDLGTTQSLYYHDDNSSHNSGDGMPETGDNAPNYESWGDIGVSFENASSPITGLYEIGYTRFFMPANQPVTTAGEMAAFYDNPMSTDVTLMEPYPVELSSFTATVLNNAIALQWTTRSETENYGYYIYRSDELNGRYERITIQIIQGAGDSDSEHTYEFIDYDVEPGETYYYKLADINFAGELTFHQAIRADYAVPDDYELRQNYPNPFNPSTTIEFSLKEPGFASIVIYNLKGEKIKTLRSEPLSGGSYRIEWNGVNDMGTPVPSGIYFCRLVINNFQKSIKMTLMK